jgi:hypothetical protein
VIPPQACVNAPQRYEVRASEAFTVIGSVSGYVHPFIENPDKSDPLRAHLCVPDKTASRLQLGRLGLTAPACDPMADPISGELPSGGFEPNPCSLTTSQFETPKSYTSDNCALPEVVPPHERETPAPAIKFRNRGLTLTLVDPYYPGDRACPVDRGGSPDPTIANGRIPLVFPSYTLSFSQTAGLTPMDLAGVTARFAPAFPVKVVAGPTSSIWVLDDGDLLSTTLGIASTRGQVFRVEGINLGISNQLQ